jgi:excisionase family DNA binding protein
MWSRVDKVNSEQVRPAWRAFPRSTKGNKEMQRLLPVDDAAAALGLGRSTVYKLIGSGELFTVRVGARRLVPEAAVDAYIVRLTET